MIGVPLSRCKGCQLPIIWAKSAKTGARMPMDSAPTDRGRFELREEAGEIVATHMQREAPGPGYESHFGTCPKSESFRR